jgi:CRP/FNR family transcriptional regulator, anaerobic regulatory protein
MLLEHHTSTMEHGYGHGSDRPTQRKSSDTLAECLTSGQSRVFAAREHLFCEGDRVTHVYKVEVGNVCVYRMLPDGRRQVIDFAYPGDIIGLGAIGEHNANASATTKTRVRCVPVSALHDVARSDPRMSHKLYEAMSEELQSARELLFTVSQRTAGERLASFLVALSRRNERRGGNPDEIVLPMHRADIADFLGLTIETVSRTFTKFRVEGLIDLEQCILVTIRDAGGMCALANGTV